VCASGLIATNLFADNLENVSSGNWSAQPDWYYPQTTQPYGALGWDPTYATSGTTNLWGEDTANRSDHSIAMSRSVAIPAGRSAYLRFNHAYGFDDDANGAYDGGVVEYSTNGGATYSDAGALLTDNGYSGEIDAGFSDSALNSPLAGRQGFVRESNGYVSTRATIGALGGQSVRFRFRIGTDATLGDLYGWFVDDIRIYTCAPPAPPDGDGDGVPDASDACPAVGASTPNGCPTPAVLPIGAPAVSGVVVTPAVTLKSAKLTACRVRGKGRRARLRCSFKRFGAVKKVSVKVTRKGRVITRGSGKLTRRGVLSIKPRKKLRKGRYRLTLKLTGTGGSTRTLRAKLRVR
jgi:hypothetical protein